MDGVSILNSSQVNGTGINNPLDSSLIENGRDSLICCVLIIDTIDYVKLEDVNFSPSIPSISSDTCGLSTNKVPPTTDEEKLPVNLLNN